MNDPSFTTHGDEALEARITAWVLGDASAFEAAELERLCAERPEWLIFKRRLEALHGLLREAETAGAAPEWTLRPAKRGAIEAILRGEQEQQMEARVRRSSWRSFSAIAACVLVTLALAALLGDQIILKRKQAVGWQETRPIMIREAEAASDGLGLDGMDRFGTSSTADEATAGGKRKVRSMVPFAEVAGMEHVPAELIEGTPKPIQLPNVVDPSEQVQALLARKSGAERFSVTTERQRRMNAPAPASQPVVALEGTIRDLSMPGGATAKPPRPEKKKGAIPQTRVGELDRVLADADTSFDAFSDSNASGRRPAALKADAFAAAEQPAMPVNEKAVASQAVASDTMMVEELALKTYGGTIRGLALDEQGGAAFKEGQQELDGRLEQLKRVDENWESAAPADEPVRPIVIDGEVTAAAEPYSTFSLNLNDASFRMAQAALAKGETPDPRTIQVEQFYNAVDYGDPSPAAGEPVAGYVEQSAHPVIPGRHLVRMAIKTASAGRSAQQALRLTLLIDLSGSMSREDRRQAMDEALVGLAGLLQAQDVVSVIGFARTPRLLADGLRGDQLAKLADLVNLDASEGGTNLEEAIRLAGQLAMRQKTAGAQNRIVLFTDGAANLGDAEPESLAGKIKELRQQGIAFDIAGIAADGLNDDLLGELARHGNGRYYVVGKGEQDQLAKQLAGAFHPAAENVKVQVRFNPQRVGSYKLIGFEKDRLNKEDFRNDKVDAAEMAAEEAGVAIYQVEVLPDGDGEVGELSVRFRDAASGGMVERTWTVAYDPAAPPLDQASPSMQLAALAMLAGEKLKGGPLADAIDFQQLGAVKAGVRQHFGASGRVGELLQMTDALK